MGHTKNKFKKIVLILLVSSLPFFYINCGNNMSSLTTGNSLLGQGDLSSEVSDDNPSFPPDTGTSPDDPSDSNGTDTPPTGGPTTHPPIADLKIFPGAEGFGTDSIGGRGGQLCVVVNLKDEGAGSLRSCLEKNGPRIVIFKVGGTISVSRSILVKNPFVSVYGQTATGDGILLRGAPNSIDTPLVVQTHDVLIQHLRLRAGSTQTNGGACCRDGAGIAGPAGQVYNVVFDHNSISWGTDQIAHTWYDANRVTFSFNIISESLYDNGSSPGGPAGRGLLIGNSGAHSISIHHNFFAHSYQRNPLVKASGVIDVVNNLSYHHVSRGGQQYGEHRGQKINWVKNHYIPLLGQADSKQNTAVNWGDIEIQRLNYPTQFYAEDNLGHHRPTNDLPQYALFFTNYNEPYNTALGDHSAVRFEAPKISETPVNLLEETLPLTVGAILPKRDVVDTRVVNELRTRTGKMPNCVGPDDRPNDTSDRCENNVGGWPTMRAGALRADSDEDGIPDSWELAHGLDPKDPKDAMSDINNDGYLNIEDWVHSIGQ